MTKIAIEAYRYEFYKYAWNQNGWCCL